MNPQPNLGPSEKAISPFPAQELDCAKVISVAFLRKWEISADIY